MGDPPSASPGRAEKDSKSHRIFFAGQQVTLQVRFSETCMQRCNCTPSSIVEHEQHARDTRARMCLSIHRSYRSKSPIPLHREYSQSYDSAVIISGLGSCRSHSREVFRSPTTHGEQKRLEGNQHCQQYHTSCVLLPAIVCAGLHSECESDKLQPFLGGQNEQSSSSDQIRRRVA
jgi:hypothetical protein